MDRARSGVIAGALRSIARDGVRRTSMADVADLGGVARATLYNHFRTKDDVLLAVVEAEAHRLADVGLALAPRGLEAALGAVCDELAVHPALRKVLLEEPALAVEIARVGQTPTWTYIRQQVAAVLAASEYASNEGAVDVVLRWLLVEALAPSGPELRRHSLSVLVDGLPRASAFFAVDEPVGQGFENVAYGR
jgi:AcrR family transcriptional regulator